jgi:hypothetical protein
VDLEREPAVRRRHEHAACDAAELADEAPLALAPAGDVLDPLGPRELASLFPYPVRVVNQGMTLIAVGPR